MSALRKEPDRIDLSAPDLHDDAAEREVALPTLRLSTAPHAVVAANDLAPPPRVVVPTAVRLVDVAGPLALGALVLARTADPFAAGIGLVASLALALIGRISGLGPSGSAARAMERFGREAEVVGFVHLWSMCAAMVSVSALGIAFALGWEATSVLGSTIAAMLLAWPAVAYLVAVRGLWRGRRRVGLHALVTAAPWLATGGLLASAGSLDPTLVLVDGVLGCWLAVAFAFGLELGRARIGSPRPVTVHAVLAESRSRFAAAFAGASRREKT